MVDVLQETEKMRIMKMDSRWLNVCVLVLLIQVAAAHEATKPSKPSTDFFPWYGIHYPHIPYFPQPLPWFAHSPHSSPPSFINPFPPTPNAYWFYKNPFAPKAPSPVQAP